jgi:hypothetical protein
MQSVRMLAVHDDLGPKLSAQDLMDQLLDELADARQPHEEKPYVW